MSFLLPIKANFWMTAVCLLHSKQLQNEVKSTPKQHSCKKSGWPQEGHCEKKSEAKGGIQEMVG